MRNESYSSLNTYKTCPKKYEFHYGPEKRSSPASDALQLGNLVHDAFAHSLQRNATIDEALEYARSCFYYGESVQEKGIKVIEYYAPLIGFGQLKPVAIEEKFTLEIEGVRLTGYIDAILYDPLGNLVLVDWKTRGKLLDNSQVVLDGQLYLYVYAARKLLGLDIEKACQVQMKTVLPAKPKLTTKGALSKTLGVTTKAEFVISCRELGVSEEDRRS
jgi:ATP-dependent helicase/DNAse subunit B